jgi:CRP-like cAMP-binding protein
MHTKPLIDYFNRLLPLDASETSILQQVFKEKKVRRRQFILQEGDVCRFYNYVVEGCFRMYMVDQHGKEHNLQFAIEDWWVADIGSFHDEEPSRLNIEAIESSIILRIRKDDLLKLYVDYPKFNRIFRVLIEKAFVSTQRRILQNISLTAEERYLDFINRYPHFFNRISNVQIASYLGITPEFLSAIRKKLANS